MTQPDLPVRFLAWDTEFFGVRIARLTATSIDAHTMTAVMDWCERERIECLYFLIDGDQQESVRLAEANQFNFVDIRMTYKLDFLTTDRGVGAATMPSAALQSEVVIRPTQPEDHAALLPIAGYSHVDSRFYGDPHFPREKCDLLYETWLAKSFEGVMASFVLTAEVEKQPVGYFTCGIEGQVGELLLLGIDAAVRGRGIGNLFMEHAIARLSKQGCTSVEVITQGRNIIAQRLYQKYGFRLTTLQLWYHRWFMR